MQVLQTTLQNSECHKNEESFDFMFALQEFVWAGSANVKPTHWWKAFFLHTEIGKIAEKILSTPLTSAATERSFSTFGNIHTKKRNRLTTDNACKITYIAHNYKLMHPKSKGEPTAKRMRLEESDSESD